MDNNTIGLFLTTLFGTLNLPGVIKNSLELVDRFKEKKGADLKELEQLSSQLTEIMRLHKDFISAHAPLTFWKDSHECLQNLYDALFDNIFIQANHKEPYMVNSPLLIELWKNKSSAASKLLHKSLGDFRSRVVPCIPAVGGEQEIISHDFAKTEYERAIAAKNDFMMNVQKIIKGFEDFEKTVDRPSPNQADLLAACKCISEGVRIGLSNADSVLFNMLMVLRMVFIRMQGAL